MELEHLIHSRRIIQMMSVLIKVSAGKQDYFRHAKSGNRTELCSLSSAPTLNSAEGST